MKALFTSLVQTVSPAIGAANGCACTARREDPSTSMVWAGCGIESGLMLW